MKLTVVVDERVLAVNVPDSFLAEAEEFFGKMDRDMDRGWQMGPEFIESPDAVQRCQIAADRLLGSLSVANENMVTLMAGYILARLPNVSAVRIDSGGELLNTSFDYDKPAAPARASTSAPARDAPTRPSGPLSKREAMAQAGKEVSAVYRVGRGWRFAIYDPERSRWHESPLLDDEKDAEKARLEAYRQRFEQLLTPAAQPSDTR